MTEPTAADRLFALIASIPGSGTVDWCGPARALLDEHRDAVLAEQQAELSRAQAEAHQYRTALQGAARRAAAPTAVPPTDRAGLRKLIADAIRAAACPGDCGKTEEQCARERIQPFVWHHGLLAAVEGSPEQFADAVLTVLFGPIPADTDTATWTAIRAIQLMNQAGRERDAPNSEPHRLALSEALGLGTSAPWDAIRERAAELAGQPVGVDRGAVLAEGIAAIEAERDATDVNVAVYPRYDGKERIALGSAIRVLRRLAAEAQRCPHGCDISHCPCLACEAEPATGAPQPETQAAPRRGDAVEQWLKTQRDEYEVRSSPQWGALDEVLDTYRLHADTGTPLGEHVCEGRVVGDCECLETPAAGKPPADTAGEEVRRCAHTDIVYGQCVRPIPHDGECFHQHQPIRIDEETDEDSLCGSERPGDENFAGQLCGLPGGHFGDHRCDEEIAGTGHTALLRWRTAVTLPGKEA